MKSKSFKLSAILSLFVALVSCGVSNEPQNDPQSLTLSKSDDLKSVPQNPTEFFKLHSAKPQTHLIQIGKRPIELKFKKGTIIRFSPKSIIDSKGNTYTGKVKVSVREVQSRSDMILNNIMTTSIRPNNKQPIANLVSGGMFNLELSTPEGKKLNINPKVGAQVALPVPRKDDRAKEMVVFQGQTTQCETKLPNPSGSSSVNWCPTKNPFTLDPKNVKFYITTIFGTGWKNCDRFWDDPRPKTTLKVTFDKINDQNTIVFMVPENMQSAISLFKSEPFMRYDDRVPVGLNTKLVALTFNDDKQYLAHKSIIVSENTTEHLDFQEKTTAEILSYLNTLN